MRLLAIDIASNKCGLAWFENHKLVKTHTLRSVGTTPLDRRLNIAEQIGFEIINVDEVVSEEPFLMGRNNQGMQRLLGVLEFLTAGKVHFVHPSTIKAFCKAGTEKLDVALAAGEMLETEQEKEIMADAIRREDFDSTDAIAIGLWLLKGGRSV